MNTTGTAGIVPSGLVIALALAAFLALGGATCIASSSTSGFSEQRQANMIQAQITGTLYLNVTDLAVIDERQPTTALGDSAALAVRWQEDEASHVLIAMPDVPTEWSDPERIDHAELTVWGQVTTYVGAGGSEPFEVSAHPIEEQWLGGFVTWNERPRVGGPTGRQRVVADGRWLRWDATAIVQRWLRNPSQSHGIALLPAEGTAEGIAIFDGPNDDAPFPLGRSPRLKLEGRPEPTPTIIPSATSDSGVSATPTATMAPPTATPLAPLFAAWLPWAKR
jgi:hypothetical protein